jgi:PKD repeat protein
MKKLYLIILLIPLVMTSCEVSPSAFFYSDKVDVLVGENVVFTNGSNNAVEYNWDFGDGTSSDVVNPIHVYNSTGTFEVALTAIGRRGNSDMAYQIVNVVIPTTLEIEVLEYYDEYPVRNASVILYPTLKDWDAETNILSEGFTNSSGKVVYTNVDEYVYYVDVWEAHHNNYTLRDEDVAFIRTQQLKPNQINKFVAWVDYVYSTKSDGTRNRELVIKKLERKADTKTK